MEVADVSYFAQMADRRLSLPQVMREHLVGELIGDGDGAWRASCPHEPCFEHDGFNGAIELVRSTNGVVSWRCHGDCGRQGTTLDAVVHLTDGVDDHLAAAHWLEERYPGSLADLFLGVA